MRIASLWNAHPGRNGEVPVPNNNPTGENQHTKRDQKSRTEGDDNKRSTTGRSDNDTNRKSGPSRSDDTGNDRARRDH